MPWSPTPPPSPLCRHIWFRERTEDGTGEHEGLRRYTHYCSKCGKVKQTVRRILPTTNQKKGEPQ